MKTLCECKWERDEQPIDADPVFERGQFWLLHFGLTYTLIDTEHGPMPVNYTVCICQDCKTGELMTFLPNQIRIIGKDIKE